MSRLPFVALAAVAACASSGSMPERPQTEPVQVAGQGASASVGRMLITSNNTPSAMHLALAPDDVWRVLPSVYDSLGIPITTVDKPSGTVGNSGFKLRRRLGSTPLSRYIECGTTQIDPNADSYDVYMSLYTQVRPDAGATLLVTGLDASAKPVAFTGDYSTCSSKGILESRIIDAIKAKLKKP